MKRFTQANMYTGMAKNSSNTNGSGNWLLRWSTFLADRRTGNPWSYIDGKRGNSVKNAQDQRKNEPPMGAVAGVRREAATTPFATVT